MENIIVQESPFGISIVPILINVKSNFYSVSKVICNDIFLFYMDNRKINKLNCLFRGTHFDKLDAVLDSGVDVTPTDAPIYLSNSPRKSIEYGWDGSGDAPRMLLLFYDCSKLKRAFVEIPSTSPQDEIDNLKKSIQ